MKLVRVWNDIEDMIEAMEEGAVEEVPERESWGERGECLSKRMQSSELGSSMFFICENESEDGVETAA